VDSVASSRRSVRYDSICARADPAERRQSVLQREGRPFVGEPGTEGVLDLRPGTRLVHLAFDEHRLEVVFKLIACLQVVSHLPVGIERLEGRLLVCQESLDIPAVIRQRGVKVGDAVLAEQMVAREAA
jgi:hypothetical protein